MPPLKDEGNVIERDNIIFVDPRGLHSPQFTNCPFCGYLGEYDQNKDPGVELGRDDEGQLWVLDGNNRVSRALLGARLVRVKSIIAVSSEFLDELLDG